MSEQTAELATVKKVFSHGGTYQIQLKVRGNTGTMTRFTAKPSEQLLGMLGGEVRKRLNINSTVVVQKQPGQYPQYVIVDVPTEGA